MSKLPTISVIMPVYNGELFLKEALESLLNQTYEDFELIVIDDASTDRSKEIALSYQNSNSRVKVISNKFEKGLPGALNTGLSVASGKYIARADADDINRLDRFKCQVQFLEKNQDIFVVGGGYAPFNPETGYRKEIFHPTSSIEIAWNYITDSSFAHPTVMFRRSVLEKFPQYPTVANEDFPFFSQIVQEYKCENLHKILIDYRKHDKNLSETKALEGQRVVKDQFYKNYSYYNAPKEYAEIFYNFAAFKKTQIKDLFIVVNISFNILNKIRNNYSLSILSPDYIKMNIKIIFKLVRSILHK